MKRICVYCGSSPGNNASYVKAAIELGHVLVSKGIGLVYGGSRIGLMGALADSVLAQAGKVTGGIPSLIADMDVAYTRLSDLRVVSGMYERKSTMIELSDGFIALPGGYGTFDELFDAITQAQLGIHTKPCGLLDVRGYFAKLTGFLDVAVEEGFIKREHREMLIIEEKPARLVERFFDYKAPVVDKLAGLV